MPYATQAQELRLLPTDTLIALVRSGNKSAFSELIARSRSMTRRIAFSILKNEADVEDALQEASLRAFIKFHTFQGKSTFSTWLTRIVINTCKIHLRRQRSRPTSSLEELCETRDIASLASTTTEADYALTDLRHKARVAQSSNLFEFAERTLQDIAEETRKVLPDR